MVEEVIHTHYPSRSQTIMLARVPSASACCSHRPRAVSRLQRVRVQALFGSSAVKESFFDFKVKDIDGRDTSLSKFKGNVVLVVNLASQCGFTPQYSELQALYTKYKAKGFTVLGFPCNQFGQQEPGDNASIKRFAASTYGITFPLMSKVDVNGAGADPVFQFLKSAKGGFLTSDIKWNFSKFLVDKEGNVVGRFGSTTTPAELGREVEKYL
ncbi:glutathione peroxidase [Haematococcus lacustris]